MTKISIVIPIYNEEKNIEILFEELKANLPLLTKDYEIIFIDDGSEDKSPLILNKLRNKQNVKIITFKKNFGQTAALDAGFKSAQGDIIIPMDGDLQNDPRDIPRLIIKLNEGYDVVSGWRFNRRDSIAKKIISKGADTLRKILFRDNIHDSGCTLKAYKKECLKKLDLYGEMHRFIPALLAMKGHKITELKVNHRERKYGKTKYNLKRTFKGFLDMLLIKFWMDFSTRPIHLLGGTGLLTMGVGSLMALYLVLIKIFLKASIANRPLLLFAILFIIMGFLFIMFGILADILMKIYYKDKTSYTIKND
jgi:glycosyltransferase involved in cell wall biosynthesis